MVSMSRFLALAAVAAVVWAIALGAAARRIARRGRPAVPAWRDRVEIGFMVLGATGAIAVAWSLAVEPRWIEVARTTIDAEAIHGRGFRIVHLSDLHSDGRPRTEERIPAIVDGLHPDLVVFTGDAANSRAGFAVFRKCMRSVTKGRPSYAVQGNWEAWWMGGSEVLEGSGLDELDGRAIRLDLGGDEVWIAGAAVDGGVSQASALEGVPRKSFAIFLHHYPAAAREAAAHGADLILSGDTHGGQLALPLLGEMIRIHRSGVWWSRGLHRVGDAWLYVSRGIGMEGGNVPRARFMSRPEIAVIDVR